MQFLNEKNNKEHKLDAYIHRSKKNNKLKEKNKIGLIKYDQL